MGFGAVRWVEVVPVGEHLQLEVGEDVAEACGDFPVLLAVAQSSEGEVDRSGEPGQRATVQVEGVEGTGE